MAFRAVVASVGAAGGQAAAPMCVQNQQQQLLLPRPALSRVQQRPARLAVLKVSAQGFGGGGGMGGGANPFGNKTAPVKAPAQTGSEGFTRPGMDKAAMMKPQEADQLLGTFDTDCVSGCSSHSCQLASTL